MSKLTRFSRLNAGLRASVALLALCAAVPAQAQTAGDTTTLAPIVLDAGGETGTGPVKGYVAKQSTTGSKTDTPLKEIPQAVSVVGKQEMNDRGVVNKIDEALRYGDARTVTLKLSKVW